MRLGASAAGILLLYGFAARAPVLGGVAGAEVYDDFAAEPIGRLVQREHGRRTGLVWCKHGQERFNRPSGHERVERHEPDLLLWEG